MASGLLSTRLLNKNKNKQKNCPHLITYTKEKNDKILLLYTAIEAK